MDAVLAAMNALFPALAVSMMLNVRLQITQQQLGKREVSVAAGETG